MKKLILFPILIFTMSFNWAQGIWDSTFLSEAKILIGSASVGKKAIFGGGKNGDLISNKIEIYDVETGVWTFSNLPEAKFDLKAVSCGSKVFFAEGKHSVYDIAGNTTVDVYDTQTGQWSTEQLSQPRRGMGIASVGNKVLFAGGHYWGNPYATFDIVDICDNETGEWSITYLSEPRVGMGVAVSGDYVFFAGGWNPSTGLETNVVDIYNSITGNWSRSYLSEARAFIGAATVGDKVLFAGGAKSDGPFSSSKRVDIYDVTNDTWSIDSLSFARAFHSNQTATVCGKAYFVSGEAINITPYPVGMIVSFDLVDIYDGANNTWSTHTLPHGLRGHSVLAVNDVLLVAGGEFGFWGVTVLDEVLVFTCSITGIKEIQAQETFLEVFPNPTIDAFFIQLPPDISLPDAHMQVYDLQGRLMMQKNGMEVQQKHNVGNWTAGVYVVRVQGKGINATSKLVIME